MENTKYTEELSTGNKYRFDYLDGLTKMLNKMEEEKVSKRDEFAKGILADPEGARNKLKEMLGWPLTEKPSPVLGVELTPVTENETETIYRMLIEVFEGVKFYGILTLKKSETPLPLVICQHGGDGASEMICGFLYSGNYNDMGTRVSARGVHTFCPQLQLWHKEMFGGENKRLITDGRFRQLGGSITAFEIYCISRCLDYFETLPEVDGRFGMVGLSYGGFYTLMTTAVETRIKVAHAVGFFNSRAAYVISDWVFNNASEKFFDAEIGALVFPRPLWIDIADEDYIFDPEPALPEAERLKKYYASAPDKLVFRVFHGTHEYPLDDAPLDFFFNNL